MCVKRLWSIQFFLRPFYTSDYWLKLSQLPRYYHGSRSITAIPMSVFSTGEYMVGMLLLCVTGFSGICRSVDVRLRVVRRARQHDSDRSYHCARHHHHYHHTHHLYHRRHHVPQTSTSFQGDGDACLHVQPGLQRSLRRRRRLQQTVARRPLGRSIDWEVYFLNSWF